MNPFAEPVRTPSNAPTAPVAVLAVDDHPGNLAAIDAVLKDLGIKAVLAASGSDALQRLLESDFSCVLLDVRMPGIDGFETAALIRKRERWKDLPIIFMTSSEPSLLDLSQGYALGAVDFITRPVEPDVLKGKVKAVTRLYAEGQHAREGLRNARSKMSLVADAVPALISYVNHDARYGYVNQAYQEWFGRRPDDIEGKHLREVLGEAAFAKIRPMVEEALSGKKVTYESTIPYKDGPSRFVRACYIPHLVEGRVAGFVALVTDLTDRRRGEEAQAFLAEAGAALASSLDYHTTLETVARLAVPRMADWCVIDLLSEEGEVERVTIVHEDPMCLARAAEYMKARPVSLSAPHGIGMVLRTGEPELTPWIPDLASQSGGWDPEDARLIADLGLRSVIIVPFRGRERILGAITFMASESRRRYGQEDLSLAQELAKRSALALENAFLYRRVRELNSKLTSLVQERTRELADSRGRYDDLSGISPVGIFRTDPRGYCVEVNARWTDITGLRLEQARGSGWSSALHPLDRERVAQEWYRAARDGRPFQAEYRFLRPDGKVTWVLGQAVAARNSAGEFSGYVGTVTDISDRKEAEEEIRAAGATIAATNAQLEAANQELEGFVHTVAHDLRSPLRAMVGYGQILADDYVGRSLDPEGQALVRKIIDTGCRMDRMTQDLLSYARVSQSDIVVEPLQIHPVLEDVLSEMAPELASRKARIQQRPVQGPVLGTPVLLKQVLANLLYNAIKFVKPGVLSEVTVSGEIRGTVVRVWVKDNGIGIPPENARRLFRLFERLHPRDYPGTGVGLALVKRAVERLGGQVGFENDPGGGSRFWFELRRP